MATDVAEPSDETKAASSTAAKPRRKGLFLGGGIVSLVGLAWALSVVAVPDAHGDEPHHIDGPFVANISPANGFQVNLAGKGGKNYLAMNIKAEIDAFDESYGTARTNDPLHQAKLIDAVLKVASRKTKSDLDDVLGKDIFREELRAALDPVLFPVHLGNEADAGARHAESGLRPGTSIDRSTMRGLFYEHSLEVDALQKTLRLDSGPVTSFRGDETDLLVQDASGHGIFVDVSGMSRRFQGRVAVGVFGRVRNIYFSSFLTQ